MKRFVYKTTNLINGKIYIGQHTTENIDDGYLGSGVILQKAFKKYGKENFKREVLKMVDGSKEDLNHAEEFFIKHYRDKIGWGMMYNATECAFGGGCHTEESKKKMSEFMKGNQYAKGNHLSEETRKKMSAARKGHPVSEETRKKIFETQKGRQFSKEHKQKISKACEGRTITDEHKSKTSATLKNRPDLSKKILCVETGGIYPSACEAGRRTGISQGNISSVCTGRYKTSGGYHWKYIEE